MKNSFIKVSVILVIALVFSFVATLNAQDTIPEWMSKLPIKKGFVYGAAEGRSADLPRAIDKAKIKALTELTKNYSSKFESFATKCDTVLGADNNIRQVTTTIKSKQSATLSGVEKVEQVVSTHEGQTVVYILLKLDVSENVSALKKAVDSDKQLRKKLDKEGLLKELNGM